MNNDEKYNNMPIKIYIEFVPRTAISLMTMKLINIGSILID